MNTCYLIQYDLRKNRDYASLIDAIKSYGTYACVLKSSWAIATTKSAAEVRDHLLRHMDADDGLFVVRSGREAAWRGVLCRDQWLIDNL